ncbi:uncharacterized protein LOC124167984 [Ischnura elegans]|uniref:uncharacterized protein LOC124167984 n=1 Tax=Ischnura elegans TaxID=197161 RepID=UPI001ED8AB6D|nr:uncharacterized protein LOC124167984 [Ischnura elegans]
MTMDLTVRKEDCISAFQGYLQSSDFIVEGYEVKTSGMTGITGRYYEISGNVRFGGEAHEIHLFAKTPPILRSQRVFVIEYGYFHREIVFYKYVVPDMIDCLPPGVDLPLPRCTLTRDSLEPGYTPIPGSAEEELIVFDDVTHRGFCRMKPHVMDIQHCRVAIKAMARFHAASILLNLRIDQGNRAKAWSNGAPAPSDQLWNLDYDRSFVTRSTESTATAVCRMWPERFSSRRGKILASLNEAWLKFHTEARTNPKYVKAFIQGDAWRNNFMFSYDKREKPVDAIIVDMQLVQYLPPVYDLIFFLHVSVRKTFRQQNTMKLLEVYHEELSQFMSPDLCESVLPLKSLLQSFEDLESVGPLISSAYIPKLLEFALDNSIRCDPDDAIGDLLNDRGERIAHYCEISPLYREWVAESYRECMEVLGFWE